MQPSHADSQSGAMADVTRLLKWIARPLAQFGTWTATLNWIMMIRA